MKAYIGLGSNLGNPQIQVVSAQQELAKFAGVGKTVVFDIEKGKETVQLNPLLKVLGVLNIQIKFETPFPQTTDENL